MVIIKKSTKNKDFFVLRVAFCSLEFIGTDFVSSIISSHVIIELSIKLVKYLPSS